MEKKQSKAQERAAQVMADILHKIETGNISAIAEIAALDIPKSWPAHKWSMGNRLLAYKQIRSLTARGFNQWKDANRPVKKGGYADVIIYAPILITKKENGQPKINPETGKAEQFLFGFNPIGIFSIDQTNGEPLKDDMTPRKLPELINVAKILNI